jgi:hypothetical protein
MKQVEESKRETDESLSNAFEDLDALMAKALDMVGPNGYSFIHPF